MTPSIRLTAAVLDTRTRRGWPASTSGCWAGRPRKGYRRVVLGQIGVLPEGCCRGVASAATSRALRLAADDGCARAGLDVNSGNVTGALRLYELLGFETVRTRVSWSVSRPPITAD